MQHPVVAFIDSFNLIRVTITQTDERIAFQAENFHLQDENENELKIVSAEVEPQVLYLTGVFFNWLQVPQGKMLWDTQNHYYYCELPRELVENKNFKFIEKGFIWFPHGENLIVDSHEGSFLQKGYLICEDKVRFILKNKMFGFQNFELILRTSQKLMPDHSYFLNYCCRNKIRLINRDIFNQPEFYYEKDDLGFKWTSSKTVFKLWSPVADELRVLLYKNSTATKPTLTKEMQKSEHGVWEAVIPNNWENYYYLYEIRIDENTWRQIDPYSRALSLNSKRSLVFDVGKTFPEGWQQQKELVLENPADAIIYELHIRDFSISPLWQGPEEYRGKFLGLTWSGELEDNGIKVKIGIEHLRELGINIIQLLPVFDFNTVDETGNDKNKIRNWGYDPVAYNVPEGSYAVHADDSRRLLEFRQMIMALHNNGFKVVMDVVYNHTANVGTFSFFDTFMPEYFYRMDNAGHYTNGSGCGNEVASEKPMVRKYILDSLQYWLTEYKIDGFRFDLMGLIDLETMQQIVTQLQAIKKDVLIYGEPWAGGASPLTNPAVTGTQKNLGFAVFNDHFRNSLRGDTDGTAKGWVMGALNLKNQVITGMMGSIDDFTASPSETINYVSAHDNYTWFDKIVHTMPDASLETQLRMARLGLAIVLTSQGIPFLHAGSEFMRSKRIPGASEDNIRNSYKASDEINKVDWQSKITYYNYFDYFRHLIEIRRKYSAFRLTDTLQIKKRLIILKKGIPAEVIALFIKGMEKETDLIIIHNPLPKHADLKLPDGIWRIIFDDNFPDLQQQARHIDSKIKIPPISTTILELD